MKSAKVGSKVEITGGTYGKKGTKGKVVEVYGWGVMVEDAKGNQYRKYLKNLKSVVATKKTVITKKATTKKIAVKK